MRQPCPIATSGAYGVVKYDIICCMGEAKRENKANRGLRSARRGQAMVEYVLVFTALALTVLVALYYFNRASQDKATQTMRVVTADCP